MGTIKGQGLMWKDLAIQQVEAYMALKSSQDRLAFLREHVTDALPADQERADIVIDLYYYTLQFGMQQAFTADKVPACHVSLLSCLLAASRGRPRACAIAARPHGRAWPSLRAGGEDGPHGARSPAGRSRLGVCVCFCVVSSRCCFRS